MGDEARRTYLVVVDDSAEARVALRFAARRAAKTGGVVEVLGIVEPQDFVQFGGVQAAMEEEQRLRIEGVVSAAIGEILDETGVETNIFIRQGDAVRTVRAFIGEREEVDALVVQAIQDNDIARLMTLDEEQARNAAIDGLWQALMLAGAQQVTPMDVDFLSYEVGEYFGMIVATFQP